MSDISERVKKIVVEHLGVEADKVTENYTLSLHDALPIDRKSVV